MFDAAGRLTLDDLTPEMMAGALGRPVALAGRFSELCDALTGGMPGR